MRTALILGASGCLGQAIALRLAKEGYALALQYHNNEAALKVLTQQLCASSVPYACFQADLTDRTAADELLYKVHQRIGSVSLLVCSAGIALTQKPLSDCSAEELDALYALNERSVMLLLRACTQDLIQNTGSAILLSSLWGVVGGSCEAPYSASKAALIGFAKAMAKELGPSGVRVNCIAPGFIRSPMNAHLCEEEIQAFALDLPLMRIGEPDEVADAAAYLAAATYVTGQVLCVDGGASL